MKGLTPTEKLIVLYAENYALRGQPAPSRKKMAEELEIPMDTLKKVLPKMRRAGLIVEEAGIRTLSRVTPGT